MSLSIIFGSADKLGTFDAAVWLRETTFDLSKFQGEVTSQSGHARLGGTM